MAEDEGGADALQSSTDDVGGGAGLGASRSKGWNGSDELSSAVGAEQQARQRLARVQRKLREAATRNAVQQHKEKNLQMGASMRKDMDVMVGRDLNAKFKAIEPAGADDVLALSELLNQKMAIFPDPNAREWFKLFKHMDDDGSGRISYKELAGMIREELKLSKADLKESKLQAVWRALDSDLSGFISAGEFGRFMRKGEKEQGVGWKERTRRKKPS